MKQSHIKKIQNEIEHHNKALADLKRGLIEPNAVFQKSVLTQADRDAMQEAKNYHVIKKRILECQLENHEHY